MTDILLQLAEVLRMASELPIVAAIPLYGIAYESVRNFVSMG